MTSTKISVAATIDSNTPAQWVVDTLQMLQNHPRIELFCLLQIDQQQPTFSANFTNSSIERIARKLIHKVVDKPRFKQRPLAETPLPEALKPLLCTVNTQTDKPLELEIDASQVDVFLHLCQAPQNLDQWPEAKRGHWSPLTKNTHAQSEYALLNRQSLLWVHLWQCSAPHSDTWQRMASHALPMQSFSITDIQHYAHGCLPVLIESRLNWLANGQDPLQYEQQQEIERLQHADAFPKNADAPTLSAVDYATLTGKLIARNLKTRVNDRLHFEQWQLAYQFTSDSSSLEFSVDDFKALTPPPDTIWADPHIVEKDGRTHVFFEAMTLSKGVGYIATAELTPDGFKADPVPVLVETNHLSFPGIYQIDDNYFMVPESSARREVSLYKATDFPLKWEKMGNLLDNINAADTILLQHDGLWWLFTNGISHPSVAERDTLMLFFSEDLQSGDWQPHPMNPIATGVDRSRMGGPIFKHNGKWHRPHQYGAYRYGYGLGLSEIHELTTTGYSETIVERNIPKHGSPWQGCHSMVRNDNVIVIDRPLNGKRPR